MGKEYQEGRRLLEMSSIIEDAAYAVQHASGQEVAYAVGNSNSGSKCSSRSSRPGVRDPIVELEVKVS
ncbi:MAG: hypothetical protein IIA87_05765 [Nanoarchaeota archaeon]|nr:hypothetical protein [Nanoarchaeota archaeon]